MPITLDTLEKQALSTKMVNLYADAINEIDDYFEYRCRSKEDQAVVHEILERLHDEFKQLQLDIQAKV